jgi:MFS superfamily sulfate permease-like transporter
MVPITALASMLIFVGYRLASPKTFFTTFKTGKEQMLVFLVTIFITIFTDLLIGIFAGILLELIFDFINGQRFSTLFKAPIQILYEEKATTVIIKGACTFSNWLSFENKINKITNTKKITIDASGARLLDHSFLENFLHLKDELEASGVELNLVGTDDMKRMSEDQTSACIRKKSNLI